MTDLLALLKRLEWQDLTSEWGISCPECGATKTNGDHGPDCALAAAIRELEEKR